MRRLFGLIGYPLTHSFSQKHFSEKFAREGLDSCVYQNFPIENIDLIGNMLDEHPDLTGFNVTHPYKEQIIPYLTALDATARQIGAVNTVRVVHRADGYSLYGYNTDEYGFQTSLREWFDARGAALPAQALILGTGGASKAVCFALKQLGIVPHFVSRKANVGVYATYSSLTERDMAEHLLIVNTTPLGTAPVVDDCPAIPYHWLTAKHSLYDLVYNPAETLFMKQGRQRDAAVHNGARMLLLQAEKAWKVWNDAALPVE